MKNITSLFLITLFLISCGKKEVVVKPRDISKVMIENLLEDSLLNVRAIEVNDKGEGVFASSNGKLGVILEEVDWKVEKPQSAYALYAESLKFDSIVPNFRSAAFNKSMFALSIGNPALLYKVIEKDSVVVVYKEEHEKVFYDAMAFWDDNEGIAIGDSIDGCLSIIITRNGGETWKKIPCEDLPKAKSGEGAFAASDTNIAIVADKTWVATTAGNVYYSEDRGLSWQVVETPIIKEKETEGIYSIAFYDALNGFAIGGDYTKAGDSSANKIRTEDGGKTWQLVGQNQSPGYRSCVQYIPNREGKELVAIGFKGIDYSKDAGNSWKHLSDEGFYTIRFINDSVAYAAGNKRISKLTFKE